MRLLLVSQPKFLSPQGRRLLQELEIERWVRVVSLWEIAIKVQIGKSPLPRDLAFYRGHIAALALIAQAQVEGLTLVTRDRVFRKYKVGVLW